MSWNLLAVCLIAAPIAGCFLTCLIAAVVEITLGAIE
jgi:hypothetical protein